MARRRTSPLENVIELVSKMPWWVGLILALFSYLILHAVAARPPIHAVAPGQIGAAVNRQIFSVLAMFGQIILPFAFILGSLISVINRLRKNHSDVVVKQPPKSSDQRDWPLPRDAFRSGHQNQAGLPKIETRPKVAADWTLEILSALEWKRFENVCAEYLRLIGYLPQETRIGADGGVDIWIYKEGDERPFGIVQCKAWNIYKVGVKPLREIYGVMSAENVTNGLFITSGNFTSEAMTFAEGKLITLFSGAEFLAKIKLLAEADQTALFKAATAGDYRTPTCPQCGIKMTLRQGVAGRRSFWGCVKFPKCKATLVFKESEAEESVAVADWAY